MSASLNKVNRMRTLRWAAVIFGGLVLALSAMGAAAEPYRPNSDTEVLQRLPAPSDATQRALRSLRQALSQDPERLDLAIDLARRYIALGRAEADPRYMGYAEAALMPWWDRDAPPLEVLVLRAVVHQSRHAFESALDDLARALARRPNHAQALLSQAFVYQATGQYGRALQSCRRLPRKLDRLVIATCAGRVLSLTGQAETGYDVLRRALEAAPRAEPRLRLWALTNLAEIAVRLGKAEAAERHFRAALDLGRRDAYLLGAYADFLLDADRPEEARALLRDRTRVDALLLRLAIAEARLEKDTAQQHRATLAARFEASRRRGSQVHRREEARFNLEVLKRPGAALRLAEANWAVQKEPGDARLVLKAAFAAGDPERARPVAEWVRGVGLEDAALDALMRRLEEGLG